MFNSLSILAVLMSIIGLQACGSANEHTNSKSLIPFTVLKKIQVRYDNEPSYIVSITPVYPTLQFIDTLKSIINEIASAENNGKFNIDVYDDSKVAQIAIESMYTKPRIRTKQENELLGRHWVASYSGGLTFEGKPAFSYEYELSIYPNIKYYEKTGAKVDIHKTMEFKPNF